MNRLIRRSTCLRALKPTPATSTHRPCRFHATASAQQEEPRALSASERKSRFRAAKETDEETKHVKVQDPFSFAQRQIGYTFQDRSLIAKALDTTGREASLSESNKRLAVVGDVVLKLVLVEDWYPSDTPRRRLNVRVDTVGSNRHLTTVARQLGLGECLLLGSKPAVRAVWDRKDREYRIVLATAVEAIIGAVYLDSGKDLQAVRRVMVRFGLIGEGVDGFALQDSSSWATTVGPGLAKVDGSESESWVAGEKD